MTSLQMLEHMSPADQQPRPLYIRQLSRSVGATEKAMASVPLADVGIVEEEANLTINPGEVRMTICWPFWLNGMRPGDSPELMVMNGHRPDLDH